MSLEEIPLGNDALQRRRKIVVFTLKNAAPLIVGIFPNGEIDRIVASFVVREGEGKFSDAQRLRFGKDDCVEFSLFVESRQENSVCDDGNFRREDSAFNLELFSIKNDRIAEIALGRSDPKERTVEESRRCGSRRTT